MPENEKKTIHKPKDEEKRHARGMKLVRRERERK
jgi:hypothetical protein